MKWKGQNYHYLQKIFLGIGWISPLFMFLPQPIGRPEFLHKFLPLGGSNVTRSTLTLLFIFILERNILVTYIIVHTRNGTIFGNCLTSFCCYGSKWTFRHQITATGKKDSLMEPEDGPAQGEHLMVGSSLEKRVPL